MFKRIFVPVDGSDTSLRSLDLACRLASESGGELRLAHVLDRGAYMTGYDVSGASGALFEALQSSAQKILAEAQAAAAAAGAQADTVLVNELGASLGEAVAAAATAWQADLIVVGTHGRRGPSRLFLGSGADQIVRLAPVPVLVTR
ncbi:MAG TPA: universal stress protein [Ramlibacter sp.]|nr:universal stress protein [Ramlibacter sp.]